jgi:uncharacterized protein YbjQ (UPF0145 family)
VLLTTIDHVPGKEIAEILGLVQGSTIRARHLGRDILAGLRNVVGGEIKDYTQMLSEARELAIRRMVEEAKRLGADAVVGLRLATAQTMAGAAEVLAYGTAVKLK